MVANLKSDFRLAIFVLGKNLSVEKEQVACLNFQSVCDIEKNFQRNGGVHVGSLYIAHMRAADVYFFRQL